MSVQEPLRATSDAVLPSAPFTPHRSTVEQYQQMIATGIVSENDPVQLLEGLILVMPPPSPQRCYAINSLMHFSLDLLGDGWEVFVRQPVVLPTSEPEPDLMLIRGTNHDYQDRFPGPSDVGLLIEVSDLSLSFDRTVKARIYAAAGIREYWIVNLVDRCVEVRRDPCAGDEPAFQTCEIVPATGSLKLVLDGQNLGEIPVASILP